jgi:P4 family phage/plasmid primase-like protien
MCDKMRGLVESCKSTTEFTHVSLAPNARYKLHVKPDQWAEFMLAYCDSVARNEFHSLAEKPGAVTQLVVDVDIKRTVPLHDAPPMRLHTPEDVMAIIQMYQCALSEVCEGLEDRHLICAHMQKRMYVKSETTASKTYSHGFHLHFPFVYMSGENHERVLFPTVQRHLSTLTLSTPVDIDKASFRNMWLLYGSAKDHTSGVYTLEGLYDCDCLRIPDPTSVIRDVLAASTIADVVADVVANVDRPLSFYYPIVFSTRHGSQTVCEVKPHVEPPRKTSPNKPPPSATEHATPADVSDLRRLLGMCSDERAYDYHKWIEVGIALHNVGAASDAAYQLWLEFSQRCASKFNEATCMAKWSSFRLGDVTIGTLRYMAKSDSPLAYREYLDERQLAYFQHDDLTDYDIAMMLFDEFGDNYRCASIAARVWYEFANHRWNMIHDGCSLRKRLSTEIYDSVSKLQDKKLREICADFASGRIDLSVKDSREKETKARFVKLRRSLRTNLHKINYMKEAADIFYDPLFRSKLDSNPELICFKNGVYDLDKGQLRDGRPDDYLSLQIPHEYTKHSMDSEHVRSLLDFFAKIFPDEEIRKYFIETTSEVFVGGNRRKLVLVWSGQGDNGKSVTQSLIELMLGPYAVKFPTSLITGKRTASSSACPELARAGNGVRWAVLQEPDRRDSLNTGILKELSGNDTFYARGLYKEGEDMNPMFKLVLICNHLPKLESDDQATWNRIRVVPFESCFVNESLVSADPAVQVQQKRFAKDPNFMKKIPQLIKPFIWYLLEVYSQVKTESKISEPSKVLDATRLYRNANDTIYQCINKDVVVDDQKTSSITIGDVYQYYKDWLKQSGITKQPESRHEVVLYLEREWGKADKNEMWFGRRLKLTQEDVESGQCLIVDCN